MPASVRRVRESKQHDARLAVIGVVASRAASRERAIHLLGRLSAAFGARRTAHGALRLIPRRGASLDRLLTRRWMFGGDRFTPAELAGLIGWPISAGELMGVRVGVSPVRLPSERIPTTGRVLGTSTYPGLDRPIAQPMIGALSHTLIAAPTGSGKSVLLSTLAEQDAAAGRGVLLLDGKGDAATSLLGVIPESRVGEVIVLDCGSRGPLPGLRLFSGPEPTLAADVALGVLSDIYRDSWGALSERYLRAGLVAVAHDPQGTVCDVPYVYTDDAYRRSLAPRIPDPMVRGVLAAYDAMNPGERANQLASSMNKLAALLGRPAVRTVLGQADGALDFNQILARGQIVVISLSAARIGAAAARLIGSLTIHQLFQATLERSQLAPSARPPFMVYIDEPKVLADVRLPLDALLEQARGLGVGVTIAPQSISQLPASVREAALTNAATRICFSQNATDARLLARDLTGVSDQDLQDLERFEALARIALGPGEVAPVVSLRTSPPSPALRDARVLLRHTERLGATTAEVDERLAARHSGIGERPAVGRVRRAS